jgi:hypothetical protein
VNEDVSFAGQAVKYLAVGDIFTHELEVRQLEQMNDIVEPARRQVVDGDDVVPMLEQHLAQMAADKTRAPGDEDTLFHTNHPFREAIPVGYRHALRHEPHR